MDNEKRSTDSGKPATKKDSRPQNNSSLSVLSSQFSVKNFCPACGAAQARNSAAYCRVCGKHLAEDYEPLDNLRSSYNLQGRRFEFEMKPVTETKNLFETNENSASTTAWAFAVYSFVPYLGILFCPGAILMGGVGIFNWRRCPSRGGRRISRNSILIGSTVFAAQIFLWWLLYIVPQLGK